jgi:subtilisin family serine protease
MASLVALSIVSAAGAARPAWTPAGAEGDISPDFTPLGLSNKPATFVVEVAGDPVTVAEAKSGSKWSQSQKDSVKAQLRSKQAPVESDIRSTGATVVASYQSAYNGIKVVTTRANAAQLATLPGVVAVHAVQTMRPDNVHGVPLIGGPAAWGGTPGYTGAKIKIAIIDTGIDYTHADFGGPGTETAYNSAHAAETLPAPASLFGPAAPRVKGGIDLVGDSYNADPSDPAYQPVPHPDPNPIDCGGHGTHVAGTAAGSGVLANGSTYTGPYNASTITSNAWTVGPGVAPQADLYAVRVFGCEGSTDVTVDAIEWAVNNNMDVINMSLGSPFGTGSDPSAVAADNAAKAGVIVVASAGNSGSSPYMTGSPSTGDGTISVAASDPTERFPAANIAGAGSSPAIVANGATFADGLSLPVKVLKNAAGAIGQGCSQSDYAGTAGMLVVTRRGTCARVARAVYGQKAGAAAVLMVNSTAAFPPFEGKITSNPDTGEKVTVTIPFLGVPGTAATRAAWLAANGKTVTLTNALINNPGYLGLASFTSFGPRSGDSLLKPDVTAPGVSIASAAMGTGNQGTILSGTSMAAPHTAGLAALVRQAHAGWSGSDQQGGQQGDFDNGSSLWKAAIVNTADPGMVAGYTTQGGGSGLVQANRAVATQVVAYSPSDKTATLNYGYTELSGDFAKTSTIKVRNLGGSPATFAVSQALPQGLTHSISISPSSVTVPAYGSATVRVTLSVGAGAGVPTEFGDAAGQILFTPSAGSNGGIALRVPYYLVPQAVSGVSTKLADPSFTTSTTATTTNAGPSAGSADWYAWGLADGRDGRLGGNDLRAVGVQTFPADGVLAFAVSTYKRWSNPSDTEWDVFVDVNNDGTDDYLVAGVDLGAVTGSGFNGVLATAVFNLHGPGRAIKYLAGAPMDSSTLVLPVDFKQLCMTGSPCLTAANPRFTYTAEATSLTDGAFDVIAGSAKFNAFTPAITTGLYDNVPAGGSASNTVTRDAAEWAKTPAKGLLIVSQSNASGPDEAQLVEVK